MGGRKGERKEGEGVCGREELTSVYVVTDMNACLLALLMPISVSQRP